MNKYIITILYFTILISCKKKCEDEQGLLTTEERSWLSYSGGEKLIFKSNNNQYDTLNVSDRIEYNTAVSHGSSGDCHPKQQSIVCRIVSHPPVLMDLTTYHKNQWSPTGKAFILTGGSVFNFLDYNPQNNILINGKTYNDVYIMNVDTSLFISKQIWCIYYTKQKGILRYDLTQGEYWEKIN